ncbi:hypothetical protein EOPP23_13960 [Endozoicomonas sp. OPT23]|uniref:hypothetical protein n=1 Tax=Endozoicomonas sp. OPT23 TaxID=2072845 RepID=UPI00129B7270|nr:hypothetical protein [Endozoicomonas sp. OPT23]MRI34096.1 hypothetical protein [Endozoicomonas sp. OPT23]
MRIKHWTVIFLLGLSCYTEWGFAQFDEDCSDSSISIAVIFTEATVNSDILLDQFGYELAFLREAVRNKVDGLSIQWITDRLRLLDLLWLRKKTDNFSELSLFHDEHYPVFTQEKGLIGSEEEESVSTNSHQVSFDEIKRLFLNKIYQYYSELRGQKSLEDKDKFKVAVEAKANQWRSLQNRGSFLARVCELLPDQEHTCTHDKILLHQLAASHACQNTAAMDVFLNEYVKNRSPSSLEVTGKEGALAFSDLLELSDSKLDEQLGQLETEYRDRMNSTKGLQILLVNMVFQYLGEELGAEEKLSTE